MSKAALSVGGAHADRHAPCPLSAIGSPTPNYSGAPEGTKDGFDGRGAGGVLRLSDSVTLILGDCVEILPTLSVDHVLTDPPYAARTHAGAMTNKQDCATDEHRQGGAKLVNFGSLSDAEFIAAARAMLKASKRWVVMTCDHRHAALTFDWPEHIRLGAWVKGAPMPQITGDRPGSGHESVLVMHNPGKKRWNGGGKAAVWHADVLKDPKIVLQPTQKPLKLALGFVHDFTEEGETICDPYMGSATTAIACIKTGRRFIGIERDPLRFENAVQRVRSELEVCVFDFAKRQDGGRKQQALDLEPPKSGNDPSSPTKAV